MSHLKHTVKDVINWIKKIIIINGGVLRLEEFMIEKHTMYVSKHTHKTNKQLNESFMMETL